MSDAIKAEIREFPFLPNAARSSGNFNQFHQVLLKARPWWQIGSSRCLSRSKTRRHTGKRNGRAV